MNIDAAGTLDDIDDLQLTKHVVQVLLKFFRLPIAKLLISVPIVERNYLITFKYMSTISLLLIALHYSDDGFVPLRISRDDEVFPFALAARHLAEETIFGHEDQLWASVA